MGKTSISLPSSHFLSTNVRGGQELGAQEIVAREKRKHERGWGRGMEEFSFSRAAPTPSAVIFCSFSCPKLLLITHKTVLKSTKLHISK